MDISRKRPETKLSVEKHITALKIAPTGVGSQSIVDASVSILDILNNNISETTSRAEKTLTELKNSLEVFQDIFEQAEERISELERRVIETMESMEQK